MSTQLEQIGFLFIEIFIKTLDKIVHLNPNCSSINYGSILSTQTGSICYQPYMTVSFPIFDLNHVLSNQRLFERYCEQFKVHMLCFLLEHHESVLKEFYDLEDLPQFLTFSLLDKPFICNPICSTNKPWILLLPEKFAFVKEKLLEHNHFGPIWDPNKILILTQDMINDANCRLQLNEVWLISEFDLNYQITMRMETPQIYLRYFYNDFIWLARIKCDLDIHDLEASELKRKEIEIDEKFEYIEDTKILR